MKYFVILLLLPILSHSQQFTSAEIARYKNQAKNITIIRDIYGVPHIYGKTDADAVFGLMYVECEDNFPKVERNYLEFMGRLSEIDGQSQLLNDLEMRLIYDSAAAKKDYRNCSPWFQKLLNSFADGINYYLYTHPKIKPLALTHFEPWFPLMYTDGSISATQDGGLTIDDMKNLYGKDRSTGMSKLHDPFYELNPSGSNGFAIAPSRTASGNAILYINPHVTFYFRDEVHMVSGEGLNAYGAVTWGQFFVYQGFNRHCGWMHTSSYADVADLFIEQIEKKDNKFFSRYDNKLIPVKEKQITINYKETGNLSTSTFHTYFTNHGPVMGSRNGQWLSLKENNRSLKSLMQSWLRTKATGLNDFIKVMDLRSNNSNNTVFADDKGHIAYWHGNFMPKRDTKYNYELPVDGSISATDWKGLHSLNEIIHIYNPSSGWIQNCNSTPFTASGQSSPDPAKYPLYMAPDGQNARAINAMRLLSASKELTIDKVIHTIGYSHYLSAFDILLPSLVKAYDDLRENDSLKQLLKEPISIIRVWDKNSSDTSFATTLAIEWAYKLDQLVPSGKTPEARSNSLKKLNSMASDVDPTKKLQLLVDVINDLQKRAGNWRIGWGIINRYQRINAGERFDDEKPSLPVGLAAATWGSLPSFATVRPAGLIKRYGVSGNSFIACVEFGKKVKAKAISTGGSSFDPSSKHFTDQAIGYINGNFKDIFFYKEDVLKHIEKKYHPGSEAGL